MAGPDSTCKRVQSSPSTGRCDGKRVAAARRILSRMASNSQIKQTFLYFCSSKLKCVARCTWTILNVEGGTKPVVRVSPRARRRTPVHFRCRRQQGNTASRLESALRGQWTKRQCLRFPRMAIPQSFEPETAVPVRQVPTSLRSVEVQVSADPPLGTTVSALPAPRNFWAPRQPLLVLG